MVLQKDKMIAVTSVLVAFVAVLPATIASIASLVIAANTQTKVEEVHKATNSMKDALVAAAKIEGRVQGAADEKAKNVETMEARAEGAKDEKAKISK